jgi:hypothetical protein
MITMTAVVPFYIDASGMLHILIIDNNGNYEVGKSEESLTAINDILTKTYQIFLANIRTVFDIANYPLEDGNFVRIVAAELFNPGVIKTPPYVWINANDMRLTDPNWANIVSTVGDYIKSRYRSNSIPKVGRIMWLGSVI